VRFKLPRKSSTWSSLSTISNPLRCHASEAKHLS
jgi:hypothetical protein